MLRGVPEPVEEKGGPLVSVTLRTKLTNPIASCAITDTKSPSHVGQRLLLHKTGTQRFVTPMPGVRGVEKKIAVSQLVHGSPPCENSSNYPIRSRPIWRFQRRRPKAKTTSFCRNRRISAAASKIETRRGGQSFGNNSMSKTALDWKKTPQIPAFHSEITHRISGCGNRRLRLPNWPTRRRIL
jgi:hypothetical protein